MATTPEGKVKAKVKKALDNMGAYHFSPATGGYGKSGVPDIVACLRGRFIAIECKAGRNRPTALQEKNLDEILEAGGVALVIDEKNVDLVVALISINLTSSQEE
jgi:Holliday junction resolvase